MITNDNFFLANILEKYYCKNCDYKCSRKNDFNKHLLTKKHKMIINDNNEAICHTISHTSKEVKKCVCVCGKIYTQKSNLSRHKKKCNSENNNEGNKNNNTGDANKNDLIKQLLLQNQQLIFDNQEFKNMILDIISKPSTINNNNCNNNQFNLNLFLNEKCKNAMNMCDFINSFQIQSSDFEDMGKLGYVQGISNIFIKNLKDLDETVRPLHCSDIKRETLYIKDNNIWNKDEKKDKIKKAITDIIHKNVKYIPIWRDENPSSLDGTNKKNDEYMKITNQVMTAITPDDDSGINKIIKNVATKVFINK